MKDTPSLAQCDSLIINPIAISIPKMNNYLNHGRSPDFKIKPPSQDRTQWHNSFTLIN